MKLNIEQLNFSYKPGVPVLNISQVKVPSGGVTALIGPNAAGKSTFMKCIAGLLKHHGTIKYEEKNLHHIPSRERTKIFSYLPQDTSFKAMLTVFEAVLLGNLHALSWRVDQKDLVGVRKIMDELGIFDLAPRYLNELSGGQKQLVSIAQSVIRNPEVLLLDEPISSLDLHHQLEIMDYIKKITHSERTTIVALHDLNLAVKYADYVVVFKDGAVYAAGKPEKIITEEMIRVVYDVHAHVKNVDGVLQVLPLRAISAGEKKDFISTEEKL